MGTDMATTTTTTGAVLERLIANADLAKLEPAQRVAYYAEVCASLGLNPLTQPFLYVTLQNRLTLYATRNATDQLRRLHGVSVRIVARERQDDLYVVTAQASLPDGRCDESTGAVPIGTLRGDALANAYMKCETKAKRRVTLSICGLGVLDESEVAAVAGARVVDVDAATGEIRAPDPDVAGVVPIGGQHARAARLWKRYGEIAAEARALGVDVPELAEDADDDAIIDAGRALKAKMEAGREHGHVAG